MIPNIHKPAVSETFVKIAHMLSDITGNDLEDVMPDAFIHEDLNMTPMELAQFLATIEDKFGIKLRRSDLEEFETVQDLVDEIDERIS